VTGPLQDGVLSDLVHALKTCAGSSFCGDFRPEIRPPVAPSLLPVNEDKRDIIKQSSENSVTTLQQRESIPIPSNVTIINALFVIE